MEEHTIARKIKELRTAQRLSLVKLAKMTGFTKGYLSRIENSSKPPPIYTLSKISAALNVDVSKLLTDNIPSPELPEITVTRKTEHLTTDGRETPYGYVYEPLAPKKLGKNMEPFLVTVSFEAKNDFKHEGEEYLYVLEGKLEFFFKDRTYILEKGDSVYFDSAFPHGGKSLGEEPAEIMIVIYSYKRI